MALVWSLALGEKESEVRSENLPSESEEETYLVHNLTDEVGSNLVVSGEDDRVGHGQLQRERGGLLCVLLRLSDLVHRGFQGPLQAEGLELLGKVGDRPVRPAGLGVLVVAQGVQQRELEPRGERERRRARSEYSERGEEETYLEALGVILGHVHLHSILDQVENLLGLGLLGPLGQGLDGKELLFCRGDGDRSKGSVLARARPYADETRG